MKKIFSLAVLLVLLAGLIPISVSQVIASETDPTNISSPEQSGPAWYDLAWHYRRPITITNSGTTLSWYEVLIKLENSNFDFSRTKNDLSDLRFTHSDGIYQLNYWIESWDKVNHLAYIWVRVPGIAHGDTTIYVYYDNPAASPASNGAATFEGFDDNWTQYTQSMPSSGENSDSNRLPMEVEAAFNWSIISGSPTIISGILNLADGTGIKSTTLYQYGSIGVAMGIRTNFGSGNGYEWAGFINGDIGQRAMVGDLPADIDDLYLLNKRTVPDNIIIPRVGGEDWHNNYHIYEVRWESDQSMVDVDHDASHVFSTQPLQVPNMPLPVTLFSYTGSNATLKVDWVYVRQYRDPEPGFEVGVEQGQVDLDVSMVDSPDPLPKNHDLTYAITVDNNSSIDATGVVMTDTLPVSVTLVSFDPSQGSCSGSTEIVCSLGTIDPNAAAQITINVLTSTDGLITNIVTTNSQGYELDMNDNIAYVETLVDSLAPDVNWEEPVHNGQDYTSYGGMVDLEASATDNDRVAWVEFLWFDHLQTPGVWISIGKDYTYPYQVQFDSNILEPNIVYQMFVKAADRAGNESNPTNPLRAIYVKREFLFVGFLPILAK